MGYARDGVAARLRQRLMAELHLGVAKGGDRLASVRRVARELDVDPRVALAAYRLLEGEGLVEVRPRSGIYVAHAAGAEALPQLAEWLVGVLVQGLARGVPAIEFPERARRCLETVRFSTACIECNHDQIVGLCTELSRDYGLRTRGVELGALRGRALPQELRDVDLLVTTPFHAAEVGRVAETLSRPLIVVHLRPGFLEEVGRLLLAGPVYFVGTDPRFEEKLRLIFAPATGVENLRPLILGRDDLSEVPENAPIFVMQAARAGVEDPALRARLIPAPRVFSEDTARELLSFIVSANMAAEAAGARSGG